MNIKKTSQQPSAITSILLDIHLNIFRSVGAIMYGRRLNYCFQALLINRIYPLFRVNQKKYKHIMKKILDFKKNP